MEEKNEKVVNGLNNCALAVLFDLFQASRGPLFYVLQRMRDFETFNSFLAVAADMSDKEFIPELAPEEKK